MRKHGWISLCVLGLIALLASSGRVFAAGGGLGKWDESTAGRRESLPERHVGATDNGISVEVTMSPGTGVLYRHVGRWEPAPAALRFSADNVNVRGNDYLPGEAVFPASVTFVFGKDSLKLGARKRLELFLKQVWNGFTPSGIRLTYVWGNGLPVGSMYRLWEEETVFVLAGPEEVGKTISSTRRLGDDFRAAYGRPPSGPVTEIRVSARRPSREKGPVRASITVRFPAPPE
ncbi:DUF3047 domain-containing protein [Candidatus Deferrimicrobium sp.]|uniref:DUF3047 domain-containing protein n=1 Tax=Candidatus Deferrimicrobium sp. TaxID=3060586 RepID=UPI002ED2399E